jgi:HSP20 family protein
MPHCSKLKLMGFSEDPKGKLYEAFKVKGSYIAISKRVWNPNTDIYETPEAVVLKLEVSGVKAEDINIVSHENRLTIRGNRRDTSPSNKERYHQMQIDYGEFEKAFIFPYPVNPDKIKAVFSDGFLEVTIPKIRKRVKEEIIIKIES